MKQEMSTSKATHATVQNVLKKSNFQLSFKFERFICHFFESFYILKMYLTQKKSFYLNFQKMMKLQKHCFNGFRIK